MKTLIGLRPEFTGIPVDNGTRFVPAIMEVDGEEIWFDRTVVDARTLERINLLVTAAYDLGIRHLKEVIAES